MTNLVVMPIANTGAATFKEHKCGLKGAPKVPQHPKATRMKSFIIQLQIILD